MINKDMFSRLLRSSAFFLPFVFFYLYMSFRGFEYPVVDDIMVNQTILSGDSMLLPYMGILLSSGLVLLQQIFTNWNIYFCFLVSIYCISFGVYAIFFYKKKLYLLLPIVFLVQLILIKYFSFSVIAYLSATAATFLLFDKRYISGLSLLFIGLSIRPQITSSFILLLLPFLLFEWICSKKRKEIVLLFSVILLIFASNKLYTLGKADVQEYLTWNALSTNLRDYPAIDYQRHANEFKALGVSENDLNVSTYWLFAEKKALSNTLLTNIQSVRSLPEKYSFNLLKMISDFFKNSILTTFFLMLIGWFLIFKPKKLYGWFVPIFPLLLIGALFVRQRVVERVYIPLIVCFLLVFIFYARSFYEKRSLFDKRKVFLSIQIMGILGGAVWINKLGQELYWFPYIQSSVVSEYQSLIQRNSNKLIVIGGYNTLVSSQPTLSTFKLRSNQLVTNTTTLGNWQTFSPHYYQQMKKYGVEEPENLLSSAINNQNILFFWSTSSGNMDSVKKIMKEHYQKDVYFEEVESVTSDMSVYRLKLGTGG